MKTNIDIRKWLLPLVVLLAAACGHDDLVPPDVYVEESTPYVEIRIAVPLANPASTRANPMGGEEGNGRERGILNEDKIHDINVFFYDDKNYGASGMNSDAATPIIFHIYYNIDNPNDESNSKLEATKENESDDRYESNYLKLRFAYDKNVIPDAEGIKFLAIANVGELTTLNIKTLGALRNLDLTSYQNSWIANDAYSKNAKTMDYFLMSTAYNTSISTGLQLTGTNTLTLVDGEYSGSTTLQRMYARIDFWYNAEANAGSITDSDKVINELEYNVIDVDGNKVFLTNVLAVNVRKTASYVFKKLTKNYSGPWDRKDLISINTFDWGGKENPFDGPYTESSGMDKPQNYVMEPYTTYKNFNGTVGDFKRVDGSAGNLTDWYGNTTVEKIQEAITDEKNGKFSDYYHETRLKGAYDKDYNCDHISIITYANENTQATNCYHRNYLTGLAFRAVYVPEKIYSAYSETADETGKTSWTLTEMPVATEPTNIYRYSPTASTKDESKSKYFSNKDAADAYAKAHPEDMAIVSKESDAFKAVKHGEQWGFICYYNLWLRHYNDVDDAKSDPHEHLPMEYATVRNNIYRVSVSFSGPGDPTPTMREPDTMKARIFVRKWNYREEGTLDFNFD